MNNVRKKNRKKGQGGQKMSETTSDIFFYIKTVEKYQKSIKKRSDYRQTNRPTDQHSEL